MSDAYVREKAVVAAHCLAVSHTDLRGRLANAWLSALDRLRREDLSGYGPEVADAYLRLELALGREAGEGSRPGAQVAAERLSDDEALNLATAVMEFYAGVMPVR